jgi:two-component system, cell cycle sensor histidine kinase and response regulator CckA
MATLDAKGILLCANPVFASLLSAEPAEIEGRRLTDFILADDAFPLTEWFEREGPGTGNSLNLECRLLPAAHPAVWTFMTLSSMGVGPSQSDEILAVVQDIRGRKRAESERARWHERIAHGQKLKALGALAGGVAHDFNNLLGVITGYISLLRTRLPREDPLQQVVATMQVSAGRAAELTQQLLHFSRQETPRFGPLSIQDSLNNVLKIVSQTFDRRILIKQNLDTRLPLIKGDAGQLELALLNLCLNARDAMPEAGTLTVESSVVTLPLSELPEEAGEGTCEFVRIVIRDTGQGMDSEVLSQIFEPFFTTKSGKNGAGLGLALVQRTVTEHGGFIGFRSKVGGGSEFMVHLPVAAGERVSAQVSLGENAARGRGTVLIVDDEPLMVDFSCEAVRELGYSVLSATDRREVPLICARKSPPIDAVLLDMVMPGPSWETTLHELRQVTPTPKMIMTSGFNRERDAQRGLELGATAFIGKPYTIEQLGQVLKKSLTDPQSAQLSR